MILDLNKERTLEIDITNKEGQSFTYEGTITTKLLDIYISAQEEMEDKLQTIRIKEDYQEIPIKEITKQQRETAKKMIKAFLGDRFDEFMDFLGLDSKYVIEQLGGEIQEELNKLGKEIKGEEIKEEGK